MKANTTVGGVGSANTSTSVEPVAAHGAGNPDHTQPDTYWSLLSEPLRHVAGFLFARDRANLGRVSRCFRQILTERDGAELLLPQAAQVCTLSEMQRVLAALDSVHCTDAQRAKVMCALDRRIVAVAYSHRDAAWRAILQAGTRMADSKARSDVYVALARRALEFHDCRSLMVELDRLASELSPPHDIAVHVATMDTLLEIESKGYHWKGLAKWPFDLSSCLARAYLLPGVQRRDAIATIVVFHAMRSECSEQAWQEALTAVMQLNDPRVRAGGLIDVARPRHVLALWGCKRQVGLPWRQAVELAISFPAELAVETVESLMKKAKVGAPDQPALTAVLWAFRREPRFTPDQRSRIDPAIAPALPDGLRLQLWDDLLQRCHREGMSDVLHACLDGHFEAWMRDTDSDRRQRHWQGVLQSCETSAMRPEVTAALCALLARHLARLPDNYRPMAIKQLARRINTLPDIGQQYALFVDVLPFIPGNALSGPAKAPLAGVPPAVQARWLTYLLSAGHGSAQLVGRLLNALRTAGQPALLAAAIESTIKARRDSTIDDATFALFAAGLTELAAGIDLTYEPAVAEAMAGLAALAREQAEAYSDPRQAASIRRYVCSTDAAIRGMPPERRQALLLSLARRNETAFKSLILDLLPSLPPVYRAPVLWKWIACRPFGGDPWSDQRDVWNAVKAVPAEHQAALLWDCLSWFDTERRHPILPEERVEWATERNACAALIARLPEADRFKYRMTRSDDDVEDD